MSVESKTKRFERYVRQNDDLVISSASANENRTGHFKNFPWKPVNGNTQIVFGASLCGYERPSNEDKMCVITVKTDYLCIVVVLVLDGHGGMEAVNIFLRIIHDTIKDVFSTERFCTIRQNGNRLIQDVLNRIHDEVIKLADSGTTVTGTSLIISRTFNTGMP